MTTRRAFGSRALGNATSIAAVGAILGALLGAAPAAAQKIVLKLHHLLPPVAPAHTEMLEPWAEQVEQDSNGRIKVEIYPAMQLGGKPPQLIDQVRDGVVDIVWTLPGYTPGRFPLTEVFELPFMHSSAVTTNKALWEFAQNHGEDFADYKLIALHVHAGQLFHSVDPIRTVEDLEGLKIRTPTRTGGWMIEAMGAVPVGAPVPQIPEMLSKRVVDAVMIPWEVTLALKVNELVDYHTVLDDPEYERINTSTFVIAMNKARYESLPDDLKKVIDDNAGMNVAEWIGEVWTRVEEPGRAAGAASGEIIKMPPGEVAKLRAMTEKPVADRWVQEMNNKGYDGKALLAEARDLLEKYAR
ncbi:MAG TPA: TRAP transporter substrate-binding protein [Kiloniellales bacterium]|nr:TRAP transporter substrate-binding protein [Kiloniellales bacterium]